MKSTEKDSRGHPPKEGKSDDTRRIITIVMVAVVLKDCTLMKHQRGCSEFADRTRSEHIQHIHLLLIPLRNLPRSTPLKPNITFNRL
jgi:hypothetical protein